MKRVITWHCDKCDRHVSGPANPDFLPEDWEKISLSRKDCLSGGGIHIYDGIFCPFCLDELRKFLKVSP